MNKVPLIYIPRLTPSASVRLICFSYAGGNPATYISWLPLLPKHVELAIVQLPGRGARIFEDSYPTMSSMVSAIFAEVVKLSPKPFMFYGHSMGARVAYEVLLLLWRFKCPLPLHFIASGSGAPCVDYQKERIHHLPDDEFIQKIGALNGSSKDVLANPEIMRLVLPALRADFKIIETYHNPSKLVIPVKVSVMAGTEDDIEHSNMDAWHNLFQSSTGVHWVSGDHYFVDNNKEGTVDVLSDILSERPL